MADSKVTALTELTAPALTDLIYAVADPGGTPASRKLVLSTLQQLLMLNGWVGANETWTYASADAPTFTFTISGDKTTKYSAGMRIKLTQTTVKYFIITAVSYGAPNTTVTIYGGTDYTLANAAITLPYYSMSKAPQGFPLDPTKWTVITTDTSNQSQASPVNGTWYNMGTLSITIPIGVWRVYFQSAPQGGNGSATTMVIYSALSTANNSASNAVLKSVSVGAAMTAFATPAHRESVLVLASKTVYYLNEMSENSSIGTLLLRGDLQTTVIAAVCAYL